MSLFSRFRSEPEDPDLVRGEDLIFSGQYEEAIESFSSVLQANPRNLQALSGIALAQERLERFEEADAFYDRVLALAPRNSDALAGKALCLEHLGKYEEAITWYERDLKVNPEAPDVWVGIGRCLSRAGRPRDAIPCFDHVLAENRTYVDAWTGRGDALFLDRKSRRGPGELFHGARTASRGSPGVGLARAVPYPGGEVRPGPVLFRPGDSPRPSRYPGLVRAGTMPGGLAEERGGGPFLR